jgi:hypothetical protein
MSRTGVNERRMLLQYLSTLSTGVFSRDHRDKYFSLEFMKMDLIAIQTWLAYWYPLYRSMERDRRIVLPKVMVSFWLDFCLYPSKFELL